MSAASDFLARCGDLGTLVVVGRVALGQPIEEADDFDVYLGVPRVNVARVVELASRYSLTVSRWIHESKLQPGKVFEGVSVKDTSSSGKLRLKCGPLSWAQAQAADYAAARMRGVTYATMKRDRDRYERGGMSPDRAKEQVYRDSKIRVTDELLADPSLVILDDNGAGPIPASASGG